MPWEKYAAPSQEGPWAKYSSSGPQTPSATAGAPLVPGAASVPPSPVARGLSGPEPSFGEKVAQNLPMSLARLPGRLTDNTPGMPYSGSEETLADPHHL